MPSSPDEQPAPVPQPPPPIENPHRYRPHCGTCGAWVNKHGVEKCERCARHEREGNTQ